MDKWLERFAWVCLLGSLIGWPYTLLTTEEPPWILSLSWFAITTTALSWISAARANREVRKQNGN